MEFAPIGVVRSTRTKVEDDHWDQESARIELDAAQFTADALKGLDAFSHVEIIFLLDRVKPEQIVTGARHPRNNPEWPEAGIFAQRAKNRPNRIGTTVCRVLSVEGLTLHVQGLDAVDGTPVLDLKPWCVEMGPRGEVFQPAWIAELMEDYWGAKGGSGRPR